MQKIRKIVRAVSEKTAVTTNQPANYYQQHRSYRTSLTPFQKPFLQRVYSWCKLFRKIIFVPCDNWKTMLFIKVYRYPEILFNRHVLVLFETSDLKKSYFNFYLDYRNTKVKIQCKYQSSKLKLSYTILTAL